MIKFCLPFPPSSNTLFRNGGFKGKRPRTAAYIAWAAEAGWQLKQQRVPKIKGPVKITLELQDDARGPNKLWDYMNREKATVDLLVTHGIIEADHRKIVKHFECYGTTDPCGVRVIITPWIAIDGNPI